MTFFNLGLTAQVAVAAIAVALLTLAGLMLAPGGGARLSHERRRPGVKPPATALEGATNAVTSLIGKMVRGKNSSRDVSALEEAGLDMRLQDFILLVIIGGVVASAAGLVLVGPVGLLLGLAAPLVARFFLAAKTRARHARFADQLDDSLQLMASSLRAGHSLLQSLSSVATESEEPTSGEFARIINETRVGRDLSSALTEVATRMESEDFTWVTQAVEINREVGGNLAEVLDGVSGTIRERNQIRRQVKVLSAEGRLSAIVLMLLPIGISGFLSFSNPSYMHKFVESIVGYGLIGGAVVMLAIGGWWLSKVVKIKF